MYSLPEQQLAFFNKRHGTYHTDYHTPPISVNMSNFTQIWHPTWSLKKYIIQIENCWFIGQLAIRSIMMILESIYIKKDWQCHTPFPCFPEASGPYLYNTCNKFIYIFLHRNNPYADEVWKPDGPPNQQWRRWRRWFQECNPRWSATSRSRTHSAQSEHLTKWAKYISQLLEPHNIFSILFVIAKVMRPIDTGSQLEVYARGQKLSKLRIPTNYNTFDDHNPHWDYINFNFP